MVSAFDGFVRRLLATHQSDAPSVREFVDALDQSDPPERSIEKAALGGALADRLGFAFVAGYHAALGQLLLIATKNLQHPTYKTDRRRRRACLAATESGGVHPKAIQTTLTRSGEGFVLRGTKTFATLAEVADDILVVARREPTREITSAPSVEPERPSIVIVHAPSDREGIRRTPKGHTPFAPEVPHSEIEFIDVAISQDEVLPGDGYSAYLKPFRTVEDLHVLAATAGHLLSVARRCSNGDSMLERIVALLAGASTLADESPESPIVHIALDALFGDARALYDEATAGLKSEYREERARLERDRPLLLVAESVRRKRLELAQQALAVG